MNNINFGFTEKQSCIVNNLVKSLKQVDGVTALAIGGSFARGTATPTSDIDIGLYYHDETAFKIDDIRVIAEQFNDEPNPTVADFGGWGKWVNGGAWLTIEGQRADFLYRSIDSLQHWIKQSKNGIIELDYYQQPATGFYSYIYLSELSICVPLWDENDILEKLKSQIKVYPPELRAKIIKEFSWLCDFNLYHAGVAAKRGDMYMLVGCLHNALAAVIQIIYAKNKRYFLSDKSVLAEIMSFDKSLPQFDVTVAQVLNKPDSASVQHLRNIFTQVTE